MLRCSYRTSPQCPVKGPRYAAHRTCVLVVFKGRRLYTYTDSRCEHRTAVSSRLPGGIRRRRVSLSLHYLSYYKSFGLTPWEYFSFLIILKCPWRFGLHFLQSLYCCEYWVCFVLWNENTSTCALGLYTGACDRLVLPFVQRRQAGHSCLLPVMPRAGTWSAAEAVVRASHSVKDLGLGLVKRNTHNNFWNNCVCAPVPKLFPYLCRESVSLLPWSQRKAGENWNPPMVKSLGVGRWKVILARNFERVSPHSSGMVLLRGSAGFPTVQKQSFLWNLL